LKNRVLMADTYLNLQSEKFTTLEARWHRH
jgi:hypothetical protein